MSSGAPKAFSLPSALLDRGFSLRDEREDDLAFLSQLFASTRAEEFAAAGWPPEQLALFLQGQFDAQRRHYRSYFPDCQFAVIEFESAPMGRLYLDDRGEVLNVVDISLLPEWRGRGIGSALLAAVQALARAGGKGVTLMVEINNPARRLYQRLGFEDIADHGIYIEMKWPAPAQLNTD